MPRISIIANPIAGGGRAGRRAAALAASLEAAGATVALRLTGCADDVARFAAEATLLRADAVVAVGGDGTLNRVLDGLVDPGTPVAMLPSGTANVLACELRLPHRPADVAAMLLAPHVLDLAIGEVLPTPDTAGPAPRRFLMFTGVGLDGAMVERLEQVRGRTLGKRGWLRPVLQVVARLPRHAIDVAAADGTVRTGLTEVLITRIRDYGGVFRLPRAIDVRDDVLHALCFRQASRWAWFWTALRGFLFGLRDGRDCERLTAREFTVRAATPTPAQTDGDFAGRTPLVVRLAAARARIVVPRETRGARPLYWRE